MNGGNFTSNGQGINMSQQQLAQLISLLAKQPAANPSSPNFDPNYFSQVVSLGQGNQPTLQQQNQQVLPSSRYNIVRAVDDPSVIKPQEVEMGVANLFPSSDGEKIFVKEWNNDGLIDLRVYVLQNPELSPSVSTDESRFGEMEDRITKLEATVAKLKKQQASKPSKPKPGAKPKPKPVETVVEEVVENGEQ